MSFIETIKKMFNIGAVELRFELKEVPKEQRSVDIRGHFISKDAGKVEGKVHLTAEGARKVKKIHFTLEQKIMKEFNGNETATFEKIGQTAVEVNVDLKAGEKKSVEFSVPFAAKKDLLQKATDKAAEQGGLLGMVGSIASFAQNVQVTYKLSAKMEIEGALFKSEESIIIKLI